MICALKSVADMGLLGCVDGPVQPVYDSPMFGHNWEPATATIIAKQYHESSGTSGSYEYVADITPASGETFRCKLKQPALMSHVVRLAEGDTVAVLADVRRQEAKFDKSDPKVSGKEFQEVQKDAFAAALEQAPGSPPPDQAA
jgi:hypothetical protein